MINHSYKKLQVWIRSMELAKKAYDLSSDFPSEEKYGLQSQIRRSAISIPSNIAEGSQRKSDKEFGNFLLISKGSLAELETQFLLAKEFNYIKKGMNEFLEEINELQKMLFSFHKRLTAKSSIE